MMLTYLSLFTKSLTKVYNKATLMASGGLPAVLLCRSPVPRGAPTSTQAMGCTYLCRDGLVAGLEDGRELGLQKGYEIGELHMAS